MKVSFSIPFHLKIYWFHFPHVTFFNYWMFHFLFSSTRNSTVYVSFSFISFFFREKIIKNNFLKIFLEKPFPINIFYFTFYLFHSNKILLIQTKTYILKSVLDLSTFLIQNSHIMLQPNFCAHSWHSQFELLYLTNQSRSVNIVP